jgi:hypothetical protein
MTNRERRSAVRAVGTALIALTVFVETRGAPSTPTYWQQAVDQVGPAKKLLSWNRDMLDPKYVDDLLATGISLDDRVDVIPTEPSATSDKF